MGTPGPQHAPATPTPPATPPAERPPAERVIVAEIQAAERRLAELARQEEGHRSRLIDCQVEALKLEATVRDLRDALALLTY